MKYSIRTIVLGATFLAIGGISADAKIVYLTPGGMGAGTSWSDPASDLNAVMENVVSGDEVWMSGGLYTVSKTINIVEGVNIRGGFAVGATSLSERVQPDTEKPWIFSEVTSIKGSDPSMRLFDRIDKTTEWKTETWIDGITVDGFQTSNGRVCYFKEKVNLLNCRFIDCGATTSITYFEDGGTIIGCLYDGTKSGVSLDLRRVKASADIVTVDNVEICRSNSCALAYYSTLGAGEVNPSEMEGLMAGTISRVRIHDNHVGVPANYNPATDNGTSAGMVITHSLTKGLHITDCCIENNSIETMGGAALICKYTGSTRFSRCVFRNNENKSDISVVTKPAAIIYSENGLLMTNCSVYNNSAPDVCFNLIGGSYLNNTWVNNVGGIYASQTYIGMVNNLIVGNMLNDSPAFIKADNAFYSEFYNNALNKDIQFIVPTGGDSSAANTSVVDGNFVLSENNTFERPTSFSGVAQTDEQAQEIAAVDWMLSESSVCGGGGSVLYWNFWTDNYDTGEPVLWYDAIYKTDLAGNSRLSGNKISIGAYEKGVSSLIKQAEEDNDGLKVRVVGTDIIFDTDESGVIEVFAINGSLIKTRAFISGVNIISVDALGIYLLHVTQNGSVRNLKIKI